VVLRLKFPSRVAEETAAFVAFQQLPGAAASDAELRRWAARVGPERVASLFALASAREATPSPARAALQGRVEALLAANPPLSARQLALDGKAIMAVLGVGPSPAVGLATRHLLELVLDDPGRNSPESLTAALKAWRPPS
jgi:tRNA nucleotidyltransferase (CCA-adding enzyme)